MLMPSLSGLLVVVSASVCFATQPGDAAHIGSPRVVVVKGFGPEPSNGEVYSSETMYWSPRKVTIEVGDSVWWQWEGPHTMEQVHNGTSMQPLYATHNVRGFGTDQIAPAEYFWTFDEPGTFYYICVPHIDCCDMRGEIIVKPSTTPRVPAPVTTSVSMPGALARNTDPPTGSNNFLENFKPAIFHPDGTVSQDTAANVAETKVVQATLPFPHHHPNDAATQSTAASVITGDATVSTGKSPTNWMPLVLIIVGLLTCTGGLGYVIHRAKQRRNFAMNGPASVRVDVPTSRFSIE